MLWSGHASCYVCLCIKCLVQFELWRRDKCILFNQGQISLHHVDLQRERHGGVKYDDKKLMERGRKQFAVAGIQQRHAVTSSE